MFIWRMWVQSLMFLLSVESFRTSLEDTPTVKPDGYERYAAIVDKYIRERSPYEVNIESRIKREILRTTDRGIFDKLTMVRSARVYMHAARPPTPSAERLISDGPDAYRGG